MFITSIFLAYNGSWITTKVASSSPAHGEVYSIQHYVIKLVLTYDKSVDFSGFLDQ